MTFKSQTTADLSLFFNNNEFSEDVTYTPKGAAGGTVKAVVEIDDDNKPENDHRRQFVIGFVIKSDVKNLSLTSPKHGDSVTLSDGRVFNVKAVRAEQDGVFILNLESQIKPAWGFN